MIRIASEMLIKAPSRLVWDVITDLGHYSDWNSQLSLINGKVEEGERIKLKFSPLYYKGYAAQPFIHRYDPFRSFGWKGMTLLPGILDGEYRFELYSVDEQNTRLKFYQNYSGILAFLLPRLQMFKDARKSCIKMNAEIKLRVREVLALPA